MELDAAHAAMTFPVLPLPCQPTNLKDAISYYTSGRKERTAAHLMYGAAMTVEAFVAWLLGQRELNRKIRTFNKYKKFYLVSAALDRLRAPPPLHETMALALFEMPFAENYPNILTSRLNEEFIMQVLKWVILSKSELVPHPTIDVCRRFFTFQTIMPALQNLRNILNLCEREEVTVEVDAAKRLVQLFLDRRIPSSTPQTNASDDLVSSSDGIESGELDFKHQRKAACGEATKKVLKMYPDGLASIPLHDVRLAIVRPNSDTGIPEWSSLTSPHLGGSPLCCLANDTDRSLSFKTDFRELRVSMPIMSKLLSNAVVQQEQLVQLGGQPAGPVRQRPGLNTGASARQPHPQTLPEPQSYLQLPLPPANRFIPSSEEIEATAAMWWTTVGQPHWKGMDGDTYFPTTSAKWSVSALRRRFDQCFSNEGGIQFDKWFRDMCTHSIGSPHSDINEVYCRLSDNVYDATWWNDVGKAIWDAIRDVFESKKRGRRGRSKPPLKNVTTLRSAATEYDGFVDMVLQQVRMRPQGREGQVFAEFGVQLPDVHLSAEEQEGDDENIEDALL